MRLGIAIVIIWLVIGVVATVQRGYLKSNNATCARSGTVAGTVVAGPLNYAGVNPKITCHLPKPSN
ncbi:MAG TPA: hypothetical protein VK662_03185 [Acidothermaceae bacterium]|jgi:hypothetical protein|nr:hypothetical protein [Acidothermaceae bacterium]